ncbi:MAG: hypothetical protein ACFFCW_40970 [Candidatus Hodarchaeota archaeon]
MKSISIKIVDKNKPELLAEAEGELDGTEFDVTYKKECDMVSVDATKHGNGEQIYSSAVIIVGESSIV